MIDLLHLFHSLLPVGISLAGTVMLPAPGGAESTPPPIVDGTEETTDTTQTTEPGESTDGSESTTEGEPETPKVETTTETKIDWRTVPAEVKAHLQELGKTNSKVANLLQNAVYTSQSFMKQFPGGLKEVQGLKQAIEESGGLDEIKNLRSTYETLQTEQEDLDNRARTGDPLVLDNLIEIAGDGFSKLMPTALDRWAAQDPASYSHVLGKVMVSALMEGNVVSELNMAHRMLGLKNEQATLLAMESLKKVSDWVNRVGEISQKAPVKPQADPQIAQQQKDIDSQKEQIFRDKFNGSFGTWRDGEIRREAGIHSKGRTLNDYQMQTLGNRVVAEIKTLLTSDKDYTKKLEKLYQSRDMDELAKLAKARTSKLLPDVVKKVHRELFSNFSGTAKPVTPKPPVKTSTTTTSTSAATGWVKVAPDKAPSPDQIDNNKTPFEMKFRKAAILKDGRRVYWGAEAPK